MDNITQHYATQYFIRLVTNNELQSTFLHKRSKKILQKCIMQSKALQKLIQERLQKM